MPFFVGNLMSWCHTKGITPIWDWDTLLMMHLYDDGKTMTRKSTILVVILNHSLIVKGSIVIPMMRALCLVKLTRPPIQGFRQLSLIPIFVKVSSKECHTSFRYLRGDVWPPLIQWLLEYKCIEMEKVDSFHIFLGKCDEVCTLRFRCISSN